MAERYSEEDAREILQRAMAQQTRETSFSREQLLEMADELGLSEAQLAVAEKNWLAERESVEEQRTFELERREFDRERQRAFFGHLATYAIVITFLFFINLFTSPDFFWVIFPALGWGMGLAFHALGTFVQRGGEEYEKEFIEWRTKRAIREDTHKRLSS